MFTRDWFSGKKVTVFGLGLNEGGVGTVRYLHRLGVAEILVTDIKTAAELKPSLDKIAGLKNVELILGQHRPEDFEHTDLVIKNPRIPWTNEYVQRAQKAEVPVIMDAALFFALCPTTILGVTGSKGKTTTASLLAHILKGSGKKVISVGIGQIGVLSELDRVTKDSVVVFELSSWRLSSLPLIKRSPHIAIVTNMYPDHLDYYGSMEPYRNDKRNIIRYQKADDIAILNADNQETVAFATGAPGRVQWFSPSGNIEDGALIRDGAVGMKRAGVFDPWCPLTEIPLRGEHQVSNVLAAMGAATAYGIPRDEIIKSLRDYSGVPHRLEYVGEKCGVRYYNDSAATIPEAAIAALKSFTEPILLIAGGSDKKLDFSALAEAIATRTKGAVFLKGAGTDRLLRDIRKFLPDQGEQWKFEVVESMGKAVELASQGADQGDVVLLSPGTASFGIFQNEFDRGNQFREAVARLREAPLLKEA